MLIAGALALSGCGGASDAEQAAHDPVQEAAGNPNQAANAAGDPTGNRSGNDAAGGGRDAAGKTDPCALASEEDVARALGKPVLRVENASVGSARVCSWVLNEDGFGVSVSVKSEDGRPAYEQNEQSLRSSKHTQKVEQVPGLGDAAFERYSNFGPTLWMLKGDLVLEIQYMTALSSDRAAKQRAMAKLIASNL